MENQLYARPPRKNWVTLIARYFAEIAIIFIGITISFVFDEWREARMNRAKEKELIQSLIVDLASKREEISGDINGSERVMRKIDTVFIYLSNGVEVPDRLVKNLLTIYKNDYGFFNPTTPTYNSAYASGIWQQLPDSTRREIFDLYNANFGFLESIFKLINSEQIDFKQKYMIPRGMLYAQEIILYDKTVLRKPDYAKIKKDMNNPEFASSMKLIYDYESFYLKMGTRTIERIDVLVGHLRKYLERLE